MDENSQSKIVDFIERIEDKQYGNVWREISGITNEDKINELLVAALELKAVGLSPASEFVVETVIIPDLRQAMHETIKRERETR